MVELNVVNSRPSTTCLDEVYVMEFWLYVIVRHVRGRQLRPKNSCDLEMRDSDKWHSDPAVLFCGRSKPSTVFANHAVIDVHVHSPYHVVKIPECCAPRGFDIDNHCSSL